MSNLTSAVVVADSTNQWGNRITTFELVYPRIIHSEILTHRMFSKNSASSRAIPFEKMVKSVEETGFTPIAFQEQHSGMQGNSYLEDKALDDAINIWEECKLDAIHNAKCLYESGVTKQLANRLLEPFSYIKVVLTATEFSGFFELRCPKYIVPVAASVDMRFKSWKDVVKHIQQITNDYRPEAILTTESFTTIQRLKQNVGMAEIHLMDLSEKMYDAYQESIPVKLESGQWHIPYKDKIDNKLIHDYKDKQYEVFKKSKLYMSMPFDFTIGWEILKIATMMCARTSYTTIDQDQSEWTIDKYIKKYEELITNGHLSPLEHCNQVPTKYEYWANIKGTVNSIVPYDNPDIFVIEDTSTKDIAGWFDNLHGFKSLRFQLEH